MSCAYYLVLSLELMSFKDKAAVINSSLKHNYRFIERKSLANHDRKKPKNKIK